jgi:hypothetical protein
VCFSRHNGANVIFFYNHSFLFLYFLCAFYFISSASLFRKPPSPEVIATLLLMKCEPCWSKLEDEGAFLVLTSLRPFFMLWATRKWTQLTGYLVNDVIAYDVCALLGPKADRGAFEELLESVGLHGRAEHMVVSAADLLRLIF